MSIVPIDSALNARTVREDTAELASYLLSDGQTQRPQTFLQRSRSSVQDLFEPERVDTESTDDTTRSTQTIPELHEPPSPPDQAESEDGPSVLSNLLKKSPAVSEHNDGSNASGSWVDGSDADEPTKAPAEPVRSRQSTGETAPTEQTPLLDRVTSIGESEYAVDLEGQKEHSVKRWLSGLAESRQKVEGKVSKFFAVAVNPRSWDRRAMFQTAVVTPASCLPAVAVGLLLNILDALSYGGFNKATRSRA